MKLIHNSSCFQTGMTHTSEANPIADTASTPLQWKESETRSIQKAGNVAVSEALLKPQDSQLTFAYLAFLIIAFATSQETHCLGLSPALG